MHDFYQKHISSKDDFDKLFWNSDIGVGRDCYHGPDYYYIAKYSQKCPKGCCYDSVVEIQTSQVRKAELTEQIDELIRERNEI